MRPEFLLMMTTSHVSSSFSMLQYNVTGGQDRSALALVTVDSPQVILAIDPMFALLNFATSPFKNAAVQEEPEEPADTGAVAKQDSTPKTTGPPFAFRVEVVQSTIMVLASDTDPKSQAIQLSIKNVVLAQQVRRERLSFLLLQPKLIFFSFLSQSKTTLAVRELGMSFGRMDAPSERVRFLDDVDITLALDASDQGSQKHTAIELKTQPIIFRASYTDIMLIMNIVNKAIALASAESNFNSKDNAPSPKLSPTKSDRITSASSKSGAKSRRLSRLSTSRPAMSKPQVLVSREAVGCSEVCVPFRSLAHESRVRALAEGNLRGVPAGSYWRCARATSDTF